MKNTKRKKRSKRPRASNPVNQAPGANEGGETNINTLSDAFSLASLSDSSCAYEANANSEKVAYSAEDPSSSSCAGSSSGSGSGSGSGSSEGFVEAGFVDNVVNGRGLRGNKQKKVIAATGTVSTVLGKEYVKASVCPRKGWGKSRGFRDGDLEKEEAEQFLCSMLGDQCELGLAVVRDVLCQCGYDVQKAFDALLELSASTYDQSKNGRYLDDNVNYNEDIGYLIECKDRVTDGASDCTSHSSDTEVQDNIWYTGCGGRNYAKVLASPEADSPTSTRSNELDLPQMVLESLFKISRRHEHEPQTMNWRNVVKKLQSLGPGINVNPSSLPETQQDTCAKGDEYHVLRKSATQHWDSVRSCYQKAEVAFSKGERSYASYLSEQGRAQTKLAREEDGKASHNIFKARNKDIENVITIDLHGQHVKQAMHYVKALLLVGTYIPSIQTLRVITGCGAHGVGKSRVKQSIIKLMQKEGIEWSEENQGVLLIKLSGCKEFSFMDSESDTE